MLIKQCFLNDRVFLIRLFNGGLHVARLVVYDLLPSPLWAAYPLHLLHQSRDAGAGDCITLVLPSGT